MKGRDELAVDGELRNRDTKLPDIHVLTYKIQDSRGSASFMRLYENQRVCILLVDLREHLIRAF